MRELSKAITLYGDLSDKIDVKISLSSNIGYGLYDKMMDDIKYL